MTNHARRIVGLLLCLAWAAPSSAERLTIYTVNYPLQYFAERIAGAHADVEFPAPDDVDPAFWRPDAKTISAYQRADLVLLNGAGYTKWIGQASLPHRRLVDTSAAFADQFIKAGTGIAHSHGTGAEHAHTGTAFTTWLDLRQAIQQADAIKRALVKKRPQLEAKFERSFTDLERDLLELESGLKAIVAGGGMQALLASHPVYQYLARAYDIDLHSVLWEPDQFPSEAQWNELGTLATESGAKWMVWEDEPFIESIARLEQIGIGSLVFDPCANRPGKGDFLSVMKTNLAQLQQAF